MRAKRPEETTRSGHTRGGTAWRDELMSCTFEAYLCISRLMDAVQIGPAKMPSPRRKRLRARSR